MKKCYILLSPWALHVIVQNTRGQISLPSIYKMKRILNVQKTISHSSELLKKMASPAVFSVNVGKPELIKPETQTPKEFKYLSNIDDQAGLRNHIPFVHFYPPKNVHEDPVPIIKQALSKSLVHYYPIAGRLREADNGKLVVDCCSEGVIFREANADVTLETLRKVDGGLRPPFLQWDRLLVDDIWGSHFITNSPLLRMQVTRLACGGFVLAYIFNHCVCDAYGAYQFVTAVSDYCRNPDRKNVSITPSWGRENLKPRSPPNVTFPHREYDLEPENIASETDFKTLAQTSVFLSKTDISALKNQINGQRTPTFDAVAAFLWRARTRTVLNPKTVVKLLFPIDTRLRYKPSLPKGYYGSAVIFPCAATQASDLMIKPLHYAAGLISDVKNSVIGDEYRFSVLDFIEANGRRGFCSEGAFVVSDMTRLRFAEVDFGWGHGLYGGPSRAGTGLVPGMVTSVISYKNEMGIEGVLAMVSLPSEAVEMFHKEVREVTGFAPVVAVSAL